MMNVAYLIFALNICFMTLTDSETSKVFYFLIANLWLILAVYLTHK